MREKRDFCCEIDQKKKYNGQLMCNKGQHIGGADGVAKFEGSIKEWRIKKDQ